ncbi:MAG: ImmA/IrrE family metallo-endopeptidase [Chloroflexi bacterium]|nr:ImmA/IrrE family metallo-endopeptidase [Chloroflexota bacterium]
MARTVRVPVKPELLRWARERAGLRVEDLLRAFPKLEAWEQGEAQPTLRQLENFARRVRVPLGYLFLATPPDESLPIPDFRTFTGPPRRPSPDLLDTLYLIQQRQAWYREYLQIQGAESLPFVGSATLQDAPEAVAAQIRRTLDMDLDERRTLRAWSEAFRYLTGKAEGAGILVMSSGIVGANTHRKLDPEEFRGFTLVDDLAPVVFVNAADTVAARIFTLAHELAHIWLGQSGVSNPQIHRFPEKAVEHWCNQVAAEVLVPRAALLEEHRPARPPQEEAQRLARRFKVSTLVILRRLYEVGRFSEETFRQVYREERGRVRAMMAQRTGQGGNFYRTLFTRVSRPLVEAVAVSTLEGHTLYRDAYRLLGIRSPEVFQKIYRSLGVA